MLSPFSYHLSGLSVSRRSSALIGRPSNVWLIAGLLRQVNKEKRGVIFKRAEQYVREYREAERERIRLARLSKKQGSYFVPAEPKLVFVVRIKG